MINSDHLIAIVAALLGAFVGGRMAVYASVKAVREVAKDLEESELRRQRVLCLANVMGLRHALLEGASPNRSHLMNELNRISILWAHDTAVCNILRDLYSCVLPRTQQPDRSNDLLIKLIRSMALSTKIPIQNLSDSDINQVFR